VGTEYGCGSDIPTAFKMILALAAFSGAECELLQFYPTLADRKLHAFLPQTFLDQAQGGHNAFPTQAPPPEDRNIW
jgi:hypothetical protein